MGIYALDEKLWFPPITEAEPEGLLAFGGDLSPDRLILAYKSGIFPWYSEVDSILWWSPNPRFVLYPQKLKVSDTMRQVLKKQTFSITFNQNFKTVIEHCSNKKRKEQDGTWINQDMIHAYCELNKMGVAKSVEVWKDDMLVGGLYGIAIGKCFFGESMFSHVSNASKAGFISFVQLFSTLGLELVDCQLHTPHLESLGAEMISRDLFLEIVDQNNEAESIFGSPFLTQL